MFHKGEAETVTAEDESLNAICGVSLLSHLLCRCREGIDHGSVILSVSTPHRRMIARTNPFKEKGIYSNSAAIKVTPTDSTRQLLDQALRLLRAIFKPGHGYRKAGIVLLGLQPRTAETQRLFSEDLYMRDRELMQAMDRLNAKHGRQTVRFGIPIKRETAWKMSRSYLSPNYTTDVNHVIKVR